MINTIIRVKNLDNNIIVTLLEILDPYGIDQHILHVTKYNFKQSDSVVMLREIKGSLASGYCLKVFSDINLDNYRTI